MTSVLNVQRTKIVVGCSWDSFQDEQQEVLLERILEHKVDGLCLNYQAGIAQKLKNFREKIVSRTHHRGIVPFLLKIKASSLEAWMIEAGKESLADIIILSGLSSSEHLISIRQKLNFFEAEGLNRSEAKNPDISIPPLIYVDIDSKNILDLVFSKNNSFDGILVNRSSLAEFLEPQRIPLEQKNLIESCKKQGKNTIVESDLMASMVHHPNPTRAEVSDLSNIILDGVDAVVLEAIVTEGEFADMALQMTKMSIDSIEKSMTPHWGYEPDSYEKELDALAYGALHAARHLNAKLICCVSRLGFTAARLSTLNPPIPIVALTYNFNVMRQLQLMNHVVADILPSHVELDSLFSEGRRILKTSFDLKAGDKVVFISLSASSLSTSRSNLIVAQEIEA